jgi:hypothetical protein
MARVAALAVTAVVLIMGPMAQDSRAPVTIEEAWLLEKLYGPAQRWVIDVVPEQSLKTLAVGAKETLHVGKVGGIRVAVLTSKTIDHLGIEFWGDRLRVYEIDT